MVNVGAQEKGLSFVVIQDCQCIEGRQLLGDPTRLRQILINLCSITLHISCEKMENAEKELIKIAVEDTGIGIPAHKVDDIFQKFTQADSSINSKYGGTGLDLAITKTFAEIMGGTIELKSEVGKGSTFTVAIPFDLINVKDKKQFGTDTLGSDVSINRTKHNARVLLVEKSQPNVLAATTFIESFGYDVDVANNGFQAIEKIKNNDYIATFIDVQMQGMNGFEATQAIQEYEKRCNKQRTHIIGMTAHALAGDLEKCLAVGMDDYICKSFNPDKLEQMLVDLM